MTISKYISDFIEEVTDITIDTNHVQDGSDKYGLFKSPGRTIRDFNDGSYKFGVISHSYDTDEYTLESKDFKSMGKIFKIQPEEIDKIFASILYYW